MREAIVYSLKKLKPNARCNIGDIGWVEQYNASPSMVLWFWRLRVVFKRVIVTTFLQGFLIGWNSRVNSLSEVILDSRLLIASGMLRIIDGGWLLCRYTYCGTFKFQVSYTVCKRRILGQV